MKKILFIVAFAGCLISCSDWLDVNKDPNYPNTATPTLLIPAAQGAMTAQIGGIMYNYCGIFSQYIDQLPECMQYNNETTYNLRVSSNLFDRSYSGLYAAALQDLSIVLKSETATKAEKFVATVLRANIFQVIVDQMDQAPYSEALEGFDIPSPKWENGKDIYDGILAELDEALESITPEDQIEIGDLIFENDMDQWIGYAKALELRILMRSSYAQDNSARIKALVDAGGFFTGDVKFAAFADEDAKRHPWYQINVNSLNTQNLSASYPLVTYLRITGDPRLAVLFKKTSGSGDYSGIIPGARVADASNALKKANFSEPALGPTTPVYFFLQSELQFFLAEAYLRFYNDDAKAKAAYEEGIIANFATRGLSSPEVIYENSACKWQGDVNNKLELIGMQKWVGSAMLNNVESWAEIRRTGIPKASPYDGSEINNNITLYTSGQLISPTINALGKGNFPKRVFFPESATLYNLNTPKTDNIKLTDKVWWDKK